MKAKSVTNSVGIHQDDEEGDFADAKLAESKKQVLIVANQYSLMLYVSKATAVNLARQLLDACREMDGDTPVETVTCDGCEKVIPIDEDFHVEDDTIITCPQCHDASMDDEGPAVPLGKVSDEELEWAVDKLINYPDNPLLVREDTSLPE